MYVITESLFIGTVHDAKTLPPNVSALLWAAGDLRIIPPDGMPFAVIPLIEYAEADPIDVEAGVGWLEQQLPAARVLVCCRAGMGRSVSLVIAYFCCVKDMTFDEAYAFVTTSHPEASPLPNIRKTIKAVQKIRQQNREGLDSC